MSSSHRKADPWVDPDASDEASLMKDRAEGQPGQRFRSNSKCNDWWIIPIYALQFIALLVVGFSAYSANKAEMTAPPSSAVSNKTAPSMTAAAFGLVGILILTSLMLSLSFLLIIRSYAKNVIWASLISFVFLIGFFVIYFGVMRRWFGMVIMLLCLLLNIWYIYAVQDRIPFSSNVLSTVSKILHQWPSTIGLALGGLLLQASWFVMWLVMGVSIFYSMHIEFEKGKPVSTSDKNPTKKVVTFQLGCVLFVLLLAFFWTSQVIRNLVHVTVSGVVATWYFLFPTAGMPPSPTLGSMKRACTTSFGSIVLASLVNAVVNALRATFQIMKTWLMSEETSCITVAVVCIVECLLRCIEAIVEYINAYALSYVAIYGKPYFESAKLTWDLLTRRGLDAVINDDLIGIACVMCSLFVGGICAGLAGFLAAYVISAGGDWKVWAILGFFLGLFLSLTVMSVIESSVITLFVCLADDPVVLKQTKRDVYDLLVRDIQARYEDVDLKPMNSAGGGGGRRSDDHV